MGSIYVSTDGGESFDVAETGSRSASLPGELASSLLLLSRSLFVSRRSFPSRLFSSARLAKQKMKLNHSIPYLPPVVIVVGGLV